MGATPCSIPTVEAGSSRLLLKFIAFSWTMFSTQLYQLHLRLAVRYSLLAVRISSCVGETVYRREQVAEQFGSVLWWGLLRTVLRWEGNRGGHLYLIRKMLRRGRWSCWTPDQDSAEERKVIVVDTCTWSGQCWDEEGDRGWHLYLIRSVLRWGNLYLIRTVLKWGRWSWWNLYLIRTMLRWGR